ncbi:MAG: signal peptide peptidase SppA [Salinivirgaceae bacterium]|jgi:protease-4|nr:signal peptide peptidase SppA [Salinivirgaceae bacterium]
MKDFLKYTLATLVGLLLYSVVSIFLFIGIIGVISATTGDKEATIEPNTILYLKLNDQIVDRATDNPFENFNFQAMEPNKQLGLNNILENLKKAKTDDNIEGVFMEMSILRAGLGTIEEIRNALLDFKESGKFIYTYSEAMTQSSYYLATVSDKIYMNPVGGLEIKGLQAKIAFFKGTLEKLGVEPLIFRYGKFKSAIEPFMLDKMSESNKEQTRTFVQSIWDHIAVNIAKERNISVEQLNKIANDFAVRNINDAVTHNIIDAAKYRDEVIDELVELTKAEKPEKLKFVRLGKYSNVKTEKDKKKHKNDKIAIIYASGAIHSGKGDNQSIGSETISVALRKARRDSTIKAIVLRVNSPGGDALASDVIWREVTLAQQVKPLIVSMGDLAASGGYYIACPADVIVANPTTLTGSIGVFGLLFNSQELMNKKLGITFDGIQTHKFSDLPDLTRTMREDEKEIIQGSVNGIYEVFIEHVAKGRNTSTDEIDKVGQGRVWSGINAIDINLIDEYGGLSRAIEIAAKKANLTDYKTVDLPEPPDPFEEIIKQLTGNVKVNLLQKELGDNYYFYQKIKALQTMQGIQARMDYDIELY